MRPAASSAASEDEAFLLIVRGFAARSGNPERVVVSWCEAVKVFCMTASRCHTTLLYIGGIPVYVTKNDVWVMWNGRRCRVVLDSSGGPDTVHIDTLNAAGFVGDAEIVPHGSQESFTASLDARNAQGRRGRKQSLVAGVFGQEGAVAELVALSTPSTKGHVRVAAARSAFAAGRGDDVLAALGAAARSCEGHHVFRTEGIPSVVRALVTDGLLAECMEESKAKVSYVHFLVEAGVPTGLWKEFVAANVPGYQVVQLTDLGVEPHEILSLHREGVGLRLAAKLVVGDVPRELWSVIPFDSPAAVSRVASAVAMHRAGVPPELWGDLWGHGLNDVGAAAFADSGVPPDRWLEMVEAGIGQFPAEGYAELGVPWSDWIDLHKERVWPDVLMSSSPYRADRVKGHVTVDTPSQPAKGRRESWSAEEEADAYSLVSTDRRQWEAWREAGLDPDVVKKAVEIDLTPKEFFFRVVGLRRGEIESYLDAGVDPGEILNLKDQGVSGDVALGFRRAGIDRTHWNEMGYVGIDDFDVEMFQEAGITDPGEMVEWRFRGFFATDVAVYTRLGVPREAWDQLRDANIRGWNIEDMMISAGGDWSDLLRLKQR